MTTAQPDPGPIEAIEALPLDERAAAYLALHEELLRRLEHPSAP